MSLSAVLWWVRYWVSEILRVWWWNKIQDGGIQDGGIQDGCHVLVEWIKVEFEFELWGWVQFLWYFVSVSMPVVHSLYPIWLNPRWGIQDGCHVSVEWNKIEFEFDLWVWVQFYGVLWVLVCLWCILCIQYGRIQDDCHVLVESLKIEFEFELWFWVQFLLFLFLFISMS